MDDARPSESVGHRIVRAMFVVIFFQLFWKFGGLLITLLVGSVFKAGPESDAYFFVSETVVFLLQTLCLKVFIPVVVPIFKENLAEEGEESAWRFASTVLTIALVVLAAVTAAGMFYAPQITARVAEGFNEQQSALTTRLMRIMFPGVLAICLATVTYALLNSYNVFGYAAAGDAVQKMLWAGIFLVASLTGLALPLKLDALAVAFVIGACATLAVHLFGLRSKLRFLRLGLPGLSGARVVTELGILAVHVVALAAGLWACGFAEGAKRLALQQAVLVVVVATYLLLLWHRARGKASPMAKFAALSVPLLFGILFAKYRDVLTNLFASFTGTGVFSDLKYARKVGEAPNTLVIAALSIAILPHLCELATGRKWSEFAGVMTQTIRIIVVFFVPLAALTVVLRRPVIELLFDRGTWSDYHLTHAGDALGLYILSLPFFAIENPIQQSFFAMQRMWTPTLVGFLGTGFHILFLFVGIEWLGYGYFTVVALVYVAARAFKNIILLLVMRMHVKILPWRESLVFLAKAAVITAGVVAAAHYTYKPVKRMLPLDAYRRHEVMIDTFNVDLKGWEAENVDEFRIVTRDDPALKDAFGDADVVDGENALMARYRRSPRRTAGLRRDVSSFDLLWCDAIDLAVVCSDDAELAVSVETYGHEQHVLTTAKVVAGTSHQIRVPKQALDDASALAVVTGLWVRDVTEVASVSAERTTLTIESLAFANDGFPADGLPRRVVDDFECGTSLWVIGAYPVWSSFVAATVEDTGERAEEPELALHLSASEQRRTIVCPLQHLDLDGVEKLTFKIRSDRDCEVVVKLGTGISGSTVIDRSQTIEVRASDKRTSASLRLDAFEPNEVGQFVTIALDVPEGVDFWLDNVAFVREPKGIRVGAISVNYEVFKLIHVGVPSAAAFVVFVVLLWLLRVEEAHSAWAWLREKVVGRVVRKLRRGRG